MGCGDLGGRFFEIGGVFGMRCWRLVVLRVR